MAQTISTPGYVGLRLVSHTQNYVRVMGSGAIKSRGSYAIYGGPLGGWSVTNDGQLSASVVAVSLIAGGTVVNGSDAYAGAHISGGSVGVAIRGTGELVDNYGQIVGSGTGSYGVELLTGGTVVNAGATGAQIRAVSVGVMVGGGPGTVQNDGTIEATGSGSGSAGTGIVLKAGGTIVNGAEDSSALIRGLSFGVSLRGTSVLTNYGTISSQGAAGVYASGTNAVTNGAPGSRQAVISGGTNGVQLVASSPGANLVVNYGSISGKTGSGVALANGGTVINGASNVTAARMTGGAQGLLIRGAGSVMNYGTIVGTNPLVPGFYFPPHYFPIPPHAPWGSYGVNLMAGGVLVNGSATDLTADIYGVFMGLQVHGGLGTVHNYGTIAGREVGIYTWLGGTLVNGSATDHSAVISGGLFGVLNTYPGDTIINYAIISSSAGNGVNLTSGGHPGAAGTLVNGSLADTVASITGLVDGVSSVNGATVTNYGTIIGTTNVGAYVTAGGVLVNGSEQDTSATILGSKIGAAIKGAFVNGGTIPLWNNTLANYGTIEGQVTGAELICFGGTLTNGATDATGALIEGGSGAGVATTGPVVLTNYGTILATSGYGASLAGAGTITNGLPSLESASIDGATGVGLFAASGAVINDGTIIGTGRYGALLAAGGVVLNGEGGAYGALISGASRGVFGRGAPTTVVNAATIESAGGIAVYLLNGGTVTNGAANDRAATIAGGVGVQLQGGSVYNYGGITGVSAGLWSRAAPVLVDNTGAIAGGAGGFGVTFSSGGQVYNGVSGASRASITGGAGGVAVTAQYGTVVNDGTIGATGSAGTGLSLAAGGSVTNGDSNTAALIYGGAVGVSVRGPSGTVVNDGVITGGGGTSGVGVYLVGGTLANGTAADAGASITSGGDGVDLNHGGTLTNDGVIAGTAGNGVYLLAGGAVTNGGAGDTTASIYGGDYGIAARGGVAVVSNDGTIRGAAGVALRAGGTVVNGAPGYAATIIGAKYQGVSVSGAPGQVDNYGTILGGTVGIYEHKGGGVTNALHALVSGGSAGVSISGGAGTVANYGAIKGGSGVGVYLVAGGALRNGSAANHAASIAGGMGVQLQGGSVSNYGGITGGTTGLWSRGASVLVDNAGVIAGGPGGFGITSSSGGQVYNGVSGASRASITGGAGGVAITGQYGTVVNDGTIGATGGAGTGLSLAAGGSVTNGDSNTAALIYGGAVGVSVRGPSGTVVNDGVITGGGGTSGVGVYLVGGTLANGTAADAGASITSGGDGVDLNHGGTLTNDGVIAGTAGNGVYLLAGGAVTNGSAGDTTASIYGGAYGIAVRGGVAVVSNDGTIRGAAGIALRAGGTVVNGAPGYAATIIGAKYQGVSVSGASGQVDNYGSIMGGTVGIYEHKGGGVTNGLHALVSGGGGGVSISGGVGTVANYGAIKGGSGVGVYLVAGGTLRNGSSISQFACIKGGSIGVDLAGSGSVTNSGNIAGTSLYGVFLQGGGCVINGTPGARNASIYGGATGVRIKGGAGVVINTDAIQSGGQGIYLQQGGSVANGTPVYRQAIIYGESTGIQVRGGAASVTNCATIGGGQTGIYLRGGGTVVNGAATLTRAQIYGGLVGVQIQGGPASLVNYGTVQGQTGIVLGASTNPGIVSNYGTIIGNGGIAINLGTGTDLLVLHAGSVIEGQVVGSGNDVLELAAGGSGTVSGIGAGAQYGGFRVLSVDSGAYWSVGGADTIGTLVNSGTLQIATGGSLDVRGDVDPGSTGVIQLQSGATLEVAAMQGSGTAIQFAAAAELVVDSAANFGSNAGQANFSGPLLQDFTSGDQIDLSGVKLSAVASEQYQAGSGVLNLSGSAGTLAALRFDPATLGAGSFHLSDDGTGHVLIGLG